MGQKTDSLISAVKNSLAAWGLKVKKLEELSKALPKLIEKRNETQQKWSEYWTKKGWDRHPDAEAMKADKEYQRLLTEAGAAAAIVRKIQDFGEQTYQARNGVEVALLALMMYVAEKKMKKTIFKKTSVAAAEKFIEEVKKASGL